MRREHCPGKLRPYEGEMIEMTLVRPCRHPLSRREPLALTKLLPRIRVVTDPKKLALLKAEAARREKIAGCNCKAAGRRLTSENSHAALGRTNTSQNK